MPNLTMKKIVARLNLQTPKSLTCTHGLIHKGSQLANLIKRQHEDDQGPSARGLRSSAVQSWIRNGSCFKLVLLSYSHRLLGSMWQSSTSSASAWEKAHMVCGQNHMSLHPLKPNGVTRVTKSSSCAANRLDRRWFSTCKWPTDNLSTQYVQTVSSCRLSICSSYPDGKRDPFGPAKGHFRITRLWNFFHLGRRVFFGVWWTERGTKELPTWSWLAGYRTSHTHYYTVSDILLIFSWLNIGPT